MIVMVLSTLIGNCHPSISGGSRKEGNGVMVEWDWEIIEEERERGGKG